MRNGTDDVKATRYEPDQKKTNCCRKPPVGFVVAARRLRLVIGKTGCSIIIIVIVIPYRSRHGLSIYKYLHAT